MESNSPLKEVMLKEFGYPCVNYVILRTGLSCSVDDILEKKGSPYSGSSDLDIGDILVWKRPSDSGQSDAVLSMTDRGPVTTRIQMGVHYGVYEGDDFVSDTCFDSENYFPRIRLMKISDGATPKEVIKTATMRTGS